MERINLLIATKIDDPNKTALHIALENKLEKIGELLISKGADINAIDIIYQFTINHF